MRPHRLVARRVTALRTGCPLPASSNGRGGCELGSGDIRAIKRCPLPGEHEATRRHQISNSRHLLMYASQLSIQNPPLSPSKHSPAPPRLAYRVIHPAYTAGQQRRTRYISADATLAQVIPSRLLSEPSGVNTPPAIRSGGRKSRFIAPTPHRLSPGRLASHLSPPPPFSPEISLV